MSCEDSLSSTMTVGDWGGIETISSGGVLDILVRTASPIKEPVECPMALVLAVA